jgi:hypothetical protein
VPSLGGAQLQDLAREPERDQPVGARVDGEAYDPAVCVRVDAILVVEGGAERREDPLPDVGGRRVPSRSVRGSVAYHPR